MKKYYFLLLILCLSSFGYEYLIYHPSNINNEARFYVDQNGSLIVKIENFNNGEISYNSTDTFFYYSLPVIRSRNNPENYNNGYISNYQFEEYYKNDIQFLNDLYTQRTNPFLNYLYNENTFNASDYINYDNYQLLYNSDGLAVESIVGGVWAGLYSDNEKDISGKLYTVDGHLIYRNGDEVNWFGSLFDKLTGGFGASLVGCFYVLGHCVKYVLVVYVVWQVFYLSLRMGKTALNRKDSI